MMILDTINREHFYLLRAYGALLPVNDITWPHTSDYLQNHLVKNLLLNNHFQLYPPSSAYQRSFWKVVINMLEESDEEVDEGIYEHYMSLLSTASTQPAAILGPPSPSYITHWWACEARRCDVPHDESMVNVSKYCSTTSLESRTTIESGTTGLRTWAASFALAQHFIHHPDLVSRRVLELGSGAGFLGMVISRLQLETASLSPAISDGSNSKTSVWLTDGDEQVISRCRDNIQLTCNSLQSHPNLHCRLLDWSAAIDEARRASMLATLNQADAEIIVGADIVYDPDIIPPLVATLHLALATRKPGGQPIRREAYIALSVRNEQTIAEFVRQADAVLDVQERELADKNQTQFFEGFEGRQQAEPHRQKIKLFYIRSKETP